LAAELSTEDSSTFVNGLLVAIGGTQSARRCDIATENTLKRSPCEAKKEVGVVKTHCLEL
jgi:hypothetical protein